MNEKPVSLDSFVQLLKQWYWHLMANTVPEISETLLDNLFLNPYLYLIFLTVLLLEYRIPAVRQQKLISVGLCHDFIWAILDIFIRVLIIAVFVRYLKFMHEQYLGSYIIDSISTWPLYGRIIASILIIDFLDWFHHLVRHKVPLFWRFHAIHHSQREMNLFTDLRVHPVDRIIGIIIKTTPMFILNISYDTALTILVFAWSFNKIYHGNIRSNYGPLKYILVTPQSHRIHHSSMKEHQDKNFGVILSIWDHIFCTQWRRYDEYPNTGIQDQNFPHETSVRGFSLLFTPLLQIIYPFRNIFKI